MKAFKLLSSASELDVPLLLRNNIMSVVDEYIIFMAYCNNSLVHGPAILIGVRRILVISLRTAMWFQILALAGGSVTFT